MLQLYVIGGDGTHRGAHAIYEMCRQRGLKVAVAGIPKTIDNDVSIIDRSFGFDTAVEAAQRAISAAHVEAVRATQRQDPMPWPLLPETRTTSFARIQTRIRVVSGNPRAPVPAVRL